MEILTLPQDKANHIVYGALFASTQAAASLLVYLLAQLAGFPHAVSLLWLAVVAQAWVIGCAAWKEWFYDAKHPDVHTVDWRDFASTCAGGLMVTAPLMLASALQ